MKASLFLLTLALGTGAALLPTTAHSSPDRANQAKQPTRQPGALIAILANGSARFSFDVNSVPDTSNVWACAIAPQPATPGPASAYPFISGAQAVALCPGVEPTIRPSQKKNLIMLLGGPKYP